MNIMPIQKLMSEIDNIGFKAPTCYWSLCDNHPIRSHVIAENFFYRLSNNRLLEILISQQKIYKLSRNTALLVPIDIDACSTFVGFCNKCDSKLFELIDRFDGVVTLEKATLIHYRIICYGIHHIKTQIKKHGHIASQSYSDSQLLTKSENEKVDIVYDQVKKGTLIDRLKYCLHQHQVRKIKLESMIVEQNFEEIKFVEIKGDFYKNPLFFGRSSILINKNHQFFTEDGYSSMPWVTYATLLSKDKSHLTFCWLKSDSEHTAFLNELDKKHIACFAYGYSDAFAVSKKHYSANKLAIDEIIKVLRTY